MQFPRRSSDERDVETHFRSERLAYLRAMQNPDGGWGYFPRRSSWLEPTCYALLALLGDRESAGAFERGWQRLRRWQLPNGGWRPNDAVSMATWTTALCVTLHCVSGTYDKNLERAVEWMIGSRGVEGGWFERLVGMVRRLPVEYDRRFKGWPWHPGTASWVEPTAHSLLALKKIAVKTTNAAINARIAEAERMLLDRRAKDGGWNYGNRRVLGVELPSYPETTAVALLGLQGTESADLHSSLQWAEKQWRTTRSPLARAWLAIALRNYGHKLEEEVVEPRPPSSDLMLTALEAMSCPEGGHQWLKIRI